MMTPSDIMAWAEALDTADVAALVAVTSEAAASALAFSGEQRAAGNSGAANQLTLLALKLSYTLAGIRAGLHDPEPTAAPETAPAPDSQPAPAPESPPATKSKAKKGGA